MSSTDIDPNKIAAEVLQGMLKDTTKAVSGGLRDFLTKVLDIFRKDLSAYIAATISKCAYIKTPIINRDRPTYLFDVYVHTNISVGKKILNDDDFIPVMMGLKSAVITGNAGSGKSMFMRYLFISLCEKGFGKIPLFIELRNLNSFAVKELLAFMYYSVVGPGGVITQDQFQSGLRNGAFTVILDGFDEVDFDQRKNIEKQILELREKFPELILIISSRPDPDNRFHTWSRFHVCHVQPMDEKQVSELISKIDYDDTIKRKFQKALKDGLFETHESFLSNPLLSIMMLITFEQTGHIPDKMHIFYEQAFDALFFLHDAAKEGVYKRKSYGDLPIDEFRNCLAAFCIVSYAKEFFSFTQSDLRDVVKQALHIEKKTIDVSDFISDLIESTCLLQMDGTEYTFTHRSFQEYFAAFFIARSPAANIAILMDQFARRREDDVVRMVFAMNRNFLEREWILPRLQSFVKISSNLDPQKKPLQYIGEVFGGLSLQIRSGRASDFMYEDVKTQAHAWFAIMDLYNQHFEKLDQWANRQEKVDSSKITKVLEELRSKNDSRLLAEDKPTRSKRRVNQLVLNASDNDWVSRTRIPGYFVRHAAIMRDLLRTVEADVANQRDLLSALIPSTP